MKVTRAKKEYVRLVLSYDEAQAFVDLVGNVTMRDFIGGLGEEAREQFELLYNTWSMLDDFMEAEGV